MERGPYVATAIVALLSASFFGAIRLEPPWRAASEAQAGVRFSSISGTFDHPRRDFRLREDKALDSVEASQIYDLVRGTLARGYPRSGDPVAQAYQRWSKYNTAPFPSKTRGNRYLNIYANRIGQGYGKVEGVATLPAGSIIAADGFALVASGEIVLGPLYIMEKMAKGFNEVSGDWRYGYLQPGGKPFGKTRGVHAARVAYCVACHRAVENRDHLYFVPQRFRAIQRR